MTKSTKSSKSNSQQGSGRGGSAGSGSGGTATTKTTATERLKGIVPESRISKGRILFILFLIALTAVLGYVTYRLLTDAEQTLAKEQFDGIADRALDQSYNIALRQRSGIITMASLVEQFFPNADEWPFININGFEIWSNNIIATSTGQNIGLLPIVEPNQIDEMEEFVATTAYPEFGNTTRITGLDATFQRYNETSGETHWNSPHKVLVPFLYHSTGLFPPLLLANYHSIELRGKEIDRVIECSEERAREMMNNNNKQDFTPRECSSVTGILDLAQKIPVETPAAVLYQPIYPAYNKSKLVGFITSAIKWHTVLENVFSSEVSGIHCVLSTNQNSQSFTYEISMGEAILLGEGDLHEKEFTTFGQTVALNSPGTYSIASPNYTLSLYPTQELFEVYATQNPVNATVGAICIVILTAAIFFLYDWLVREEFNQKEAMEKARRQFVRFISHEVRTPLNAVCMGLQLLQDDAARVIADNNSSNSTINSSEQEQNKHTDDDLVNGNDNPSPPLFTLSSSPAKESNEYIEEEKVVSAKLSTTTASTTTTTTTTTSTINGVRFPPPPPQSDNDDCKETTTREDTLQDQLKEIAGLSNDILSNATSAVDVLNDMLNYDKVESGTLQLEITVFSIWELIENTYTEFYQQAQFNNINCKLDYSALLDDNSNNHNEAGITSFSQLPVEVKSRKVVGDKIRIAQVLRNLISNALKFTPENGTLTVRPDWKRDNNNNDKTTTMSTKIKLDSGEEMEFLNGGMLEVKVTDTGQGMNKEQLSRLFGEGVQFNVNKLQAGQGSGLGLYIAKGILEQHGGSLRADSEGIGHGTVFTMTTPLYYIPDPEQEEPQHQQLRRRTYPLEKMEPLNILVVDDSPINRKMLTRLLQNQGHVCTQAEDGLAAIESVKNAMTSSNATGGDNDRYYDAILMDYQMPNMDGPTATKEIRAMGCDSFIVGVTGNLFAEDVSYFKECGANQVFAKPLEIRLLLDAFVEHGIG